MQRNSLNWNMESDSREIMTSNARVFIETVVKIMKQIVQTLILQIF